MSEKYKIREKEKAYFTTSTIVGWIDVFTRPNHKMRHTLMIPIPILLGSICYHYTTGRILFECYYKED